MEGMATPLNQFFFTIVYPAASAKVTKIADVPAGLRGGTTQFENVARQTRAARDSDNVVRSAVWNHDLGRLICGLNQKVKHVRLHRRVDDRHVDLVAHNVQHLRHQEARNFM